jgi:hypothetical protein
MAPRPQSNATRLNYLAISAIWRANQAGGADMPLIQNERVKLTATWLNTLAAAAIVTGVLAPIAAIIFGLPASGTLSAKSLLFVMLAWLLFGITLHWVARYVIGRLRE